MMKDILESDLRKPCSHAQMLNYTLQVMGSSQRVGNQRGLTVTYIMECNMLDMYGIDWRKNIQRLTIKLVLDSVDLPQSFRTRIGGEGYFPVSFP